MFIVFTYLWWYRSIPIKYYLFLVISYGWVNSGGEDDSKRKLYTTSDNGRLLGPICLVVSVVMFIATAVLRTLSTNARFRQTRVGFHCPVHGDFFPISPGPDPRNFSCESLDSILALFYCIMACIKLYIIYEVKWWGL